MLASTFAAPASKSFGELFLSLAARSVSNAFCLLLHTRFLSGLIDSPGCTGSLTISAISFGGIW